MASSGPKLIPALRRLERFNALALVVVTLAVTVATCAAPKADTKPTTYAKPTVALAVQPAEAVADLTAKSEELRAFLEKETGFDVKVFVPTSPAAVVEALGLGTLGSGNADFALMGALPALVATLNELAGAAEISLAEVREVADDGKTVEATYYYSYYIVLKDSPISRLEDLRGKKVAFTIPLSTSGFLFPAAELVRKGLVSAPAPGQVFAADDLRKKLETEFFKEAVFAGGYAQAWEALKRGQVDAAVIAGDVSKSLYDEVLAGSKVLTKQGPVPSHVRVARKDLDPAVKAKVEDAFLRMGQPEQRDMMRKFVSAIFVRFQPTTWGEHFKGLNEAVGLTGYKIVLTNYCWILSSQPRGSPKRGDSAPMRGRKRSSRKVATNESCMALGIQSEAGKDTSNDNMPPNTIAAMANPNTAPPNLFSQPSPIEEAIPPTKALAIAPTSAVTRKMVTNAAALAAVWSEMNRCNQEPTSG